MLAGILSEKIVDRVMNDVCIKHLGQVSNYNWMVCCIITDQPVQELNWANSRGCFYWLVTENKFL